MLGAFCELVRFHIVYSINLPLYALTVTLRLFQINWLLLRPKSVTIPVKLENQQQ